jgi:hypothetical protein
MGTTAQNRSTRRLYRPLPSRALILGFTVVAVLVSVPSLAQAVTRSGDTIQGRHSAAVNTKAKTSSICNKVSASTISSIIGYQVPAPIANTVSIKPSKANYEISGTDTTCTYGAETSMATLLKAVTLSYEVISKPITTSEMQESIKKVSASAKIKFTSYSGLGVPGYYFSLTEEGITGQGITGVDSGTHYFGASVENKKVSKSTLGALAKLAEKL